MAEGGKMISPERAAKFKSHVSLVSDEARDVLQRISRISRICELPSNLGQLWDNRKYETFMDEALDCLEWKCKEHSDRACEECGPNMEAEEVVDNLLFVLPALRIFSKGDKEVHKRVQTFYAHYRTKQLQSIKKSLKNYDETTEENSVQVEKRLVEIGKRANGKEPKHEYFLLDVALKFLKKQKVFYKLDSPFVKQPGVYLIYYIGTEELYKGSGIYGSGFTPVYVGQSESDIKVRLKMHEGNILAAPDHKLGLHNFAVRVILVDIKYYSPSIEGMLIGHFYPVWNGETVGFSFGNASDPTNLWNRFHIQEDAATIEDVLSKLKLESSSDEKEEGEDGLETLPSEETLRPSDMKNLTIE